MNKEIDKQLCRLETSGQSIPRQLMRSGSANYTKSIYSVINKERQMAAYQQTEFTFCNKKESV